MKDPGIHGYDEPFVDHEFYDEYGDDGWCWGDEYGCYDDEE